MIERLIAELCAFNNEHEPDTRAIADSIWLGQFYRITDIISASSPPIEPPPSPPSPPGKRPKQQPQAVSVPQSTQQVAATTDEHSIYPPSQRTDKQRGGRNITVAGASPLPDALNIARSLRTLRQRVPSKESVVLDEHTTVQQTAHAGGYLTPVFRTTSTRWLSVDLVLDATPSMAVWRKTILEFRTLLVRQGAFRQIRTWTLDTDTPTISFHSGIGLGAPRQPHEVSDVSGRRLILLFSDCVSAAWQSGAVQELCFRWGQTNPLAIVQMLPTYLWDRSVIGMAEPTQIAAQRRGGANADLRASKPFYFDEMNVEADSIAVPVLTLDAATLRKWAAVLAGKRDARINGVWFEHNATTVVLTATHSTLTAEERVRRFYETATKATQHLAGLLAHAPITLPIIRLVQAAMLPESGLAHVAEIMLSGLIYIVEVSDDPEQTSYDFHTGVRKLVQQSIAQSEARQIFGLLDGDETVIQAISAKLVANKHSTREIMAVASDISEKVQSIAIPERAFARIKLGWLGIDVEQTNGITHNQSIQSYETTNQVTADRQSQEQGEVENASEQTHEILNDSHDDPSKPEYIPRPEIEKEIDIWLRNPKPKYRSRMIESSAGQGKSTFINHLHDTKYAYDDAIYSILINVKQIKSIVDDDQLRPDDAIIFFVRQFYDAVIQSSLTQCPNLALPRLPTQLNQVLPWIQLACGSIGNCYAKDTLFPRFVIFVDGYEEIEEYSQSISTIYQKFRKKSILNIIEKHIVEPMLKYPFIFLLSNRRIGSTSMWPSRSLQRVTDPKIISLDDTDYKKVQQSPPSTWTGKNISEFYIPRPKLEADIDTWLRQQSPAYRGRTIEAPAGQGKTEFINHLHHTKYVRDSAIYSILINVASIKNIIEDNKLRPDDALIFFVRQFYDAVMQSSLNQSQHLALPHPPMQINLVVPWIQLACTNMRNCYTENALFPRFVIFVDGYEEIEEYSQLIKNDHPELQKQSLLRLLEKHMIEPLMKYSFVYLLTTRRTNSKSTKWNSFSLKRSIDENIISMDLWEKDDAQLQFDEISTLYITTITFDLICDYIQKYDWQNPRANKLIIEDALENGLPFTQQRIEQIAQKLTLSGLHTPIWQQDWDYIVKIILNTYAKNHPRVRLDEIGSILSLNHRDRDDFIAKLSERGCLTVKNPFVDVDPTLVMLVLEMNKLP